MPRFNFLDIKLSNKADIRDVMSNFNKIEDLGITSAEVDTKITNALADYTPTNNLSGLATSNYSYGTEAPTGGSNGDIYDQYFE